MVKCSECGFLAQSVSLAGVPQGFIGIEAEPRNTGRLPGVNSTAWFGRENRPQALSGGFYPVCFMQVVDFEDLSIRRAAAGFDTDITKSIADEIQSERECVEWRQWIRGLSPKDYREMIDRKWMIEREDRRDREDKQWREDQEAKARKWQLDQSRTSLRWNVIIFGILVTALIIGGQIVSAFIERGDLFGGGGIDPVITPSTLDTKDSQTVGAE